MAADQAARPAPARGGLLPRRRRGGAPAGPHLGRGGARLQRGRPRDRRHLQRRAADDPRRRGRARLRRAVAQRRAGAADRGAAVRVAAVLRRARRCPTRTRCSTRPGWLGDLGTFDSPMDKAIDPKVAEGLAAAWRARAVLGLGPELEARIAGAVDARGARAVLPLPERAAEPDQLERRALRLRGDADRQPRELLRRRLPPPHAPLRRRRAPAAASGAGRATCRRATASSTRPTAPLAQERRLGRVREHHAALPQLVRAGAAGRDAPAPAADMRAAARVGGARAVRLLDAQRDAQLGQRAGLQALDEGQDVGLRAAGAAGDRELAALLAAPAAGRVGEVRLRPRAVAVRDPLRAARAARTSRPCTSTTSAASTRAPAAGGSTSPAWARTRRARSSAASGRWTPSRRRPSTPSTPTSAA